MLQIARKNSTWRLVLLLPLLCAEMSATPSVKSIGPGLYAYISDNDSSSNATFLVGSKGILVVDTGFDGQEGGKLLQAIRGVSSLPVQFIVNTHYHRDHQGGNPGRGQRRQVPAEDQAQ